MDPSGDAANKTSITNEQGNPTSGTRPIEIIAPTQLQSEASSTNLMTDDEEINIQSNSAETPTFRSSMGGAMHWMSDVINDNLIATRFGVMASVILLSAYGMSQTPLFFRFRTIHDIPSSYFARRKTLYGRIVEVDKNSTLSCPDGSLHVYLRHLSPVGQVLPKSWFDFFRKLNTTAVAATASSTASSSGAIWEHKRDLLKVRVAGVQYPPFSQFRYKTDDYLEQLARDRTLVSCQLLARQVPKADSSVVEVNGGPRLRSKRSVQDAFPEFKDQLVDDAENRGQQYYDAASPSFTTAEESLEENLGVCKLRYRPSLFQFFPTDIAVSLILSGNANVSSSLMSSENQETENGSDDFSTAVGSKSTTIVDYSQRLDDLRNDVKYLERLTQAEYGAIKNEAGIWAFSEVRQTKSDVVAEIEFQANANIVQKLWRRLRGG